MPPPFVRGGEFVHAPYTLLSNDEESRFGVLCKAIICAALSNLSAPVELYAPYSK